MCGYHFPICISDQITISYEVRLVCWLRGLFAQKKRGKDSARGEKGEKRGGKVLGQRSSLLEATVFNVPDPPGLRRDM